MKKKRGFTLIELLAVIVILAIIALVATPMVLKLIDNAQRGAARISAISYIKEVNRLNTLTIENPFHGEISDITENEWLKNVELSGTMPSSGYLTIDETGTVSTANLCVNKYNVIYENKKATVTGKCAPKRGEFDIIDNTPGDLNCQVVNESKTCYIESIEDLVVFSDMVNGTNGQTKDNFENTYVILKNSLDINNDLSYANLNKKWNYDINGNGKEENLKDELTNDAGFMPIGKDSTNPFKGVFDGNGYTIKNITIYRSNDNNVAMFGYNEGIIRGLNIKNINVTGNQNVAGLVADNKGTVSMINLEGNINGTHAAGIVSQSRYTDATIKDVIMNGTVTGTNTGGLAYSWYKVYGIVENGTYANDFGSGSYGKISYIDGKVTAGSYNSYAEKMVEASYNNISSYNDYVQTILLGANEDGYYFDYNDDYTDIIVKHISNSPINNTLKGSGTKEDPYLIYSESDMRKMAIQDTEGKYYSLKSDLNYKFKEYYVIGTVSKPFKGIFDGNGYTISNITLIGNNYIAMFGYNEGIIRGLNIKNINVTGNQNVAGLVADNKGTVSMINLEGNINGTHAAGIVSQSRYTDATIKDVIMNGTVTGTNTGGLAYSWYKVYGIVENGTYANDFGSGSYGKISYIDGKVTAGSYNSYAEKMVEASYNNISSYNDYVQTILLGANEDGYYFDYNDDYTDIIVKHISNSPINNTLKGNGTKEDPYLIFSEDDMRKLSFHDTNKKYYSLQNDIDYADKQYYIIGTVSQPFKGIFDGNGHTISNITLIGNDYLAMFGYNEGIIRGLNIKNINVTGNQNVAGLVADNKGTVSMINLEGNINGTHAAGIVSQSRYTDATIKDVIMNGTVTGTNTGGLAYSWYKVYGIVENGTYANDFGSGSYGKISYIDGKVTAGSYNSYAEKMVEASYNNISSYNDYVQTILLGANEDGYYFDYNDDYTDIIVKHISNSPINNTLKGSGTKEDPYLIYSESDMRKMAIQDTEGKYYSLKSDLNYKFKEYYVIGTVSKPFKGIFDGNGYTISNITLIGNNYIAMFGYNEGIIRGLNIKNINVTGNQNVAGLVADNKGTVSMINLEGNINGTHAAGIVSQSRYTDATIKDVIMNGTVTGTNTGGLAYSWYIIYGIVENGTYANDFGSGSYGKISYIDGKVTAGSYNSYAEKMIESAYNNLDAYGTYIKVTSSNADEDGYYFDYNSDNSDIVVKKVNS